MDLVFILNCDRTKIVANNDLSADNIEWVKIDEKFLAKFSEIRKKINSGNYSAVYLATKDISFQRFQRFFRFYIMASNTKKGAIIDESGKQSNFSMLSTIFVDLPMLVFEAIISSVIVVFYYIKLPWLKWRLKKH